MGRQRTIDDAEFWRSPRIANRSQEDKATLLYLLTSPYSNIIGVYPIVPRIAASEMGWTADQLIPVLERLASLELISFDEPSGFVWVRIWWYHNRLRAAFLGNLAKRAYAELCKVPSNWRTDVQNWIASHDDGGIFVPLPSPLGGASIGLNQPQQGAAPNLTTNLTFTTTYNQPTSNGGGVDQYDLEDLVTSAIWAAIKGAGIHNEAAYRSAIKTRIQQNGPSSEDLQTLAAWRSAQHKAQAKDLACQLATRQAEEHRAAQARDIERISTAFNNLPQADQELILRTFEEHVASCNPIVLPLLKKHGLKNPLVHAALTEYLRTVPISNRATTAA